MEPTEPKRTGEKVATLPEVAGGRDGAGRRGKRRGREASLERRLVKLSQVYVFSYVVIVLFAVASDVWLRTRLDQPVQSAVVLLATASTVLYFVALGMLLVAFSARLGVLRHHSLGLRLLYAGVAALLVARGYFSASLVLPQLQQGPWPSLLADVGLLGATLVLLGLVVGMFDAVRWVFRRLGRVRLPRRKKSL